MKFRIRMMTIKTMDKSRRVAGGVESAPINAAHQLGRASSSCNQVEEQSHRARQKSLFGVSVCLTLCLVLLTTTTAPKVAAFPSGAPESACKDLKPGHGGDAATGTAPFELTQDKLQVEAGDQIKVTLSSPSKTNFKGLIVQALNEKGEPKGKFLAGKGLKTLDSCSAVTHSDREAKKTATLVWEAPTDLKSKEAFSFKATVVQKFDEFYMNIKSTLSS